MQARAAAVGDGEVMHIALAMHPCRRDAPVRAVFLAIFGEAETEPRIKIDGVLHLGGEHIEMVEPLGMCTPAARRTSRSRCTQPKWQRGPMYTFSSRIAPV